MMGVENQLLLNVCKTFLEQTFTKHCHLILFKYFMLTVNQKLDYECLKNVSSLMFISSAIL